MVYQARDREVPDLSSGNAILIQSSVYSCACVSETTGRRSSRLVLPPRPLLEGCMAQGRKNWLFACVIVGALLAPVAAVRAQDSTVACKDGTTGTAGRGACSHHGGVNKAGTATTASPTPAATTPAATTKSSTSTTTPAASTGTPVTCKDGTTGTAGRGACSHHGGVGTPSSTTTATTTPATAAPAKTSPAPASSTPTKTTAASPSPTTTTTTSSGSVAGKSETTDPTGAIAKCKDGLYSHSKTHTGTCSRHGGVAQWLDGTAQ
jgi:hypothetical protein